MANWLGGKLAKRQFSKMTSWLNGVALSKL
jgi:hypothetical protein